MTEENKKREYHFGEKIKNAREKKHMTLKNVALLAGVSESLVSQIEHNKVSPAIDTLLDLANVLDLSLEFLFEEYSRRRPVSIIHDGERRKINEDYVTYEELSDSFSVGGENCFECYYLTLKPGCQTHRGNYGHLGKEMGHILEGKGRLCYENKFYDLQVGDSVTFSAHSPHNLENTGDKPLKAIWIVTPPQKFNS